MKIIDYIEDMIPDYALSYLVNGDASGLEDEDQEAIDSWYDECRERLQKRYPEGQVDFVLSDEESSFTPHPAFGLACDCIQGAMAVWVDNDHPTPDMPLPWEEEEEEEEEEAG